MKTHLDLFSGIGGFALAAKWAGFTTIGFCEYEDFPRRVLSARFPGVPIHGDIRELNGEQYRGVTLITGGFPCQPFSVSGKQKGKADDRYLWPEMLRVIAQAKPDWVVAENVTGLIALALDQVLSDLESEGYATGTVIVPACAVDAPHRRDRVWIIGRNTEGNREPACAINAETPRLSGDVANTTRPHLEEREYLRRKKGPHVELAGPGQDVANANSQRLQRQRANGSQEGRQEPPKRPAGLCNGTASPDWWEVEPPVGRVVDGLPGRVDRLKGLGNAIVPQVAYEILRLLTEK